MKNALILHGTDSSPQSNWFPWLKSELESRGYTVQVPQLPNADKPDMNAYKAFLLGLDFEFNDQTIVIGHSSGAVAALGLLQELKTPVSKAIMVGSFRGNLGWDVLNGLTEEPDYSRIKGKASKIVFVHSDNDPYCPIDHARHQANATGGELVVLEGQGHFSYEGDERFREFPELLKIVEPHNYE